MRWATLGVVVALASLPAPASACGGLFCSTMPVAQAGERVLYARGPLGERVMIVEIVYSGLASDFSWLLPVPSVPTLGASTGALFDALDRRSAPSFRQENVTEGVCRLWPACMDRAGACGPGMICLDAGMPTPTPTPAPDPMPVEVIRVDTVGPYETVVLDGTSAVAITDWLRAHGYVVPVQAPAILADYLASGHVLVAVRLRPEQPVAAIRPLSLTFEPDAAFAPCLPLRLTGIATVPDLPITAFFLADARVVPSNYVHLQPVFGPEAFSPGFNYTARITREADAVGGRAFVTDFAGPTPALPLARPSVLDLASADASTFIDALDERGYLFVPGSSPPSIAPELIPLLAPELSPSGSVACLLDRSCDSPAGFDAARLAGRIDREITQPLAFAQALFERSPYLTRLYTTMSAAEMTFDPEFREDAGLGDLSNVHVSRRVTECSAAHLPSDAPWRLELEDGSVMRAPGRDSPDDVTFCGRYGRIPAGSCACRAGAAGSPHLLIALACWLALLVLRARSQPK